MAEAAADSSIWLRRETACAKVNFGLRVLGRRPDGYHLLESVLVPVDLADEVSVEVAPSPVSRVDFECRVAPDAEGVHDFPEGGNNLAVRAAEAFLEESQRSLAVSLGLVKRIPVAAGLGGGSSDAGAVLRALNALAPDALGPERLASVALSLGADVPFFLGQVPARVEGVGEKLSPIRDFPGLSLVLANPGEGLSTGAVFEAWDAFPPALTPVDPGSTLRSLSDWLKLDPGDSARWKLGLREVLENDLQEPARRLCPSIDRVQQALREGGAEAVGLSGSGATSFGVFASESEAKEAIRQFALRGDGWARLARTLPAR